MHTNSSTFLVSKHSVISPCKSFLPYAQVSGPNANCEGRSQALSFVGDLKFGHYMKIPPRTMFMCQVVATTFSCFIQIAVLNFALGHIDGVCETTQPERFTCPGGRVFFSGT